jgi:hypothetical protein
MLIDEMVPTETLGSLSPRAYQSYSDEEQYLDEWLNLPPATLEDTDRLISMVRLF